MKMGNILSVQRAFSTIPALFYSWALICILLTPLSMIGQDSLLQRLKIVDEPTEKLSLLIQVVSANFYNDTNLADSCANVYINLTESMGDDSLYFNGIIAKASIKLMKAEYDSTFYFTRIVIDKLGTESYPLLSAKLLHVNALAYYYNGNYEKSLEQNFGSLRIREALSRSDLQIISLTNIAIAYERLEDYDNAILYNEKALELTPQDDIYSQATLENNIAGVFIIQGKLSEALEYLQSANKSAITIDNKLLIVDTHIGLAKTYFALEEYSKAQLHANEALALSEIIDSKAKHISSLNIIGDIKIKSKDYAESVPLLNKALQISLDNNIEETRMDVYQNLSEAYLGLKDYRAYGRMKDSIILMKNKIYQEEKIKITKELNIKYESIKKDVIIKESQLNIEKQKNQKYILFTITGFILLLAAFIFTYMRNRLKSNKKIALQQNKIQSQQIDQLEKDKKILGMNAMIEGQELERTRIAKDLHDGLGGLLSTVKAHFSNIQSEIQKIEKINVYNRANELVDEACDEVRRISHNLMPGALRLEGLKSAVENLGEEMEAAHPFFVKVEIIGMETRMEESREVFVYRIIQEALNNIIKHADAKEVLIQLSETPDEYHFIVEDDGKGFDPLQIESGLGLKSIQSRVDFLKGNLDVDTKVGVGTTLSWHIPKL